MLEVASSLNERRAIVENLSLTHSDCFYIRTIRGLGCQTATATLLNVAEGVFLVYLCLAAVVIFNRDV